MLSPPRARFATAQALSADLNALLRWGESDSPRLSLQYIPFRSGHRPRVCGCRCARGARVLCLLPGAQLGARLLLSQQGDGGAMSCATAGPSAGVGERSV